MPRPENVDAYLQALPADRRAALSTLRQLLREWVPDAQEAIAYSMPSYRVGRRYAFSLASQKEHLGFYVWGKGLIDPWVPRLGKVTTAAGAVRFKRLEDLHLDVLREMVLAIAAQFRAR